MMQQNVVYAVYGKDGMMASGTLLDCWRWLINEYGEQLAATPMSCVRRDQTAFDIADAGLYIAPLPFQQKSMQDMKDGVDYLRLNYVSPHEGLGKFEIIESNENEKGN